MFDSLWPFPSNPRPTDCSPPGSSVPGIFQARKLVWVAISSSRGSFQPGDWTHVSWVSCTGRQILDYHATRGALTWDKLKMAEEIKCWIPWQLLTSLSWILKTAIPHSDSFQDLDCSLLLKMLYFHHRKISFFLSIVDNQIMQISSPLQWAGECSLSVIFTDPSVAVLSLYKWWLFNWVFLHK